LIEKIVGFAEHLTPITLIGAGGIGKTSIALTVLHDDRIKRRFGHDRRFIRCDKFPASLTHFLARLSKVTGAGVENPEDLTPLQPFLSSREMFIVLDNAESILDPQGTDAEEIYAAVEELSHFSNIWLCITSRISTIPPDYKTLSVPTLSMDAAHETFHRIYEGGERSDRIGKILEQLDFHPLSITLLATVAHHNKWSGDRLAMEWDVQRTRLLRTQHNKSLAAAIELSLASPMFQELGPDARGLLGVIAFFPRGVDENNLDWLFPTIPNVRDIFDKFCVLSLAYRSDGFITMLAPLRDNLHPEDPKSSPLLCTTEECYIRRLSVNISPGQPGYEEARWIISEDVNVEHLLDVFTSIDGNSDEIWDACVKFMGHLYWHKPRLVLLGSKLEGLPDNHPSKPKCLFGLSQLFDMVGKTVECKRLLVHTLKLWREQGNDFQVARTLGGLAEANRLLCLYNEGILQAKESSEIFEQLGTAPEQADALRMLALLFRDDNQLDAAEEAASRSIDLLPDNEQFRVCQGRGALGDIYHSKGEAEKAINHLEAALEIASSSNWQSELFSIHHSLAEVFYDRPPFYRAHTHFERAKSHVVNNPYSLCRAMELHALLYYEHRELGWAESELLDAVDIFEELGDVGGVKRCRSFLRIIDEEMGGSVTSDDSGVNSELSEIAPLSTPVNSPFSAEGDSISLPVPPHEASTPPYAEVIQPAAISLIFAPP
jgi:tetratricopeptide (TPR) repeat protein